MQTAENSLVPAGCAGGPLNQVVRLVLDSVTSPNTKTAYRIALHDFMTWVGARGLPFTKATVNSWKTGLEARGFSSSTINARLSPVRKLAVGCGLRRGELVSLTFEHLRAVEDRFVIADLVGKGGRVRTVPMLAFAKAAVDRWAEAAGVNSGRIFRSLKATYDLCGRSGDANACIQSIAEYATKLFPG